MYVAITRAAKRVYILGKKGIEFESFLDLCLQSKVQHEKFHSLSEEEKIKGFSKEEKEIIDKTTIELEDKEKRKMEE